MSAHLSVYKADDLKIRSAGGKIKDYNGERWLKIETKDLDFSIWPGVGKTFDDVIDAFAAWLKSERPPLVPDTIKPNAAELFSMLQVALVDETLKLVSDGIDVAKDQVSIDSHSDTDEDG